MTGLQTLMARLLLGVAGALAGLGLAAFGRLERITPGSFRRVACGLFLITRLGLFGIVFLLLEVAPRGDVQAYYFPEASAALGGSLPYRDFVSSYAPLHSYLDGVVLLMWHSQLALILFAVCVEFLLFNLWLRVGWELFSEREVRVGAALYLTSAISLQYVAIDGQDNVLVALFVLISLWLAMRSRMLLSGASTALAAVLVKLIPIFYVPVFLAAGRRRSSWAAGFLGVFALGYGSFAALHLPLLQPLAIEGSRESSGTLPFVLTSLLGLSFAVLFWRGIMLLALCLVYVAVWRASVHASDATRIWSMLWGIASSTMLLLIFSTKSWPAYLVLVLFPMCVVAAGSGLRARAAFALFGIIAVIEHSYWATMFGEVDAADLHRALLQRDLRSFLLLGIELLLLGGYAWFLREFLLRATGRIPRRVPGGFGVGAGGGPV